MVSLLENTFQISAIILFLCAIYYYRHFKITKKKRTLTAFEFSIYILTKIALYLFAASYMLLLLNGNFSR